MPNETKKDEVQVTLLKDGHTHKGKPCKKGDIITVTAAQAQFLINQDMVAGKKEG
jgi:hypothetical protein